MIYNELVERLEALIQKYPEVKVTVGTRNDGLILVGYEYSIRPNDFSDFWIEVGQLEDDFVSKYGDDRILFGDGKFNRRIPTDRFTLSNFEEEVNEKYESLRVESNIRCKSQNTELDHFVTAYEYFIAA